jgi:CheY-like chemotaxis protein
MLVHASEGLHIPLHRIENDDQLNQLMKTYSLTHLFIGQYEYEENVTYYEGLDSSIQIIVVAENRFPLPQNSRIRVVKTPFYSFTLASAINSGESEQYFSEKQMLCPGVRVLVVDDEEMNLMVAEGIFKQYGMIVRTAKSGSEAIRTVELEEFDIIFLDHMMPEMDGIETMLHLRRNLTRAGRSVSIVALTANAVSGARETFISAGFDGFLPKPIEYTELERILKLVLPKSAITYVDKEKLAASEEAVMLLSDNTPLRQIETLTILSEGGINTRAGIRYCKGDSAFYNELLISFAMTSVDRLRELKYFFEERNWPDYNIRVHALKSTSKMIGAERLSELARAAEEASRDADTEYLFSHQKELIRTYERTVQLIHDAVGVQPPEEETVTEEIGRQELIEKMNELISCLETFEGDKAEGIIRSLSSCSYRGKPLSALLKHTGLLVAEFDLKAAAADASAILERITEGEDI